MGDPNLGSDSKHRQISGLAWHSDSLNRLEQIGWDGVPRPSAEKLESTILSSECLSIRGHKGSDVRKLRNG